MLFPTLEFAVFFAIVFVVNWMLRPRRIAWQLFMLGASLVFYGWWNPRFVLLLGGSILGNWVLATLVDRTMGPEGRTRTSHNIVRLAVALNLMLLGLFKYYGFFVESLRSLLGANASFLPLLELTLPVGISFFTFQALSYVVDVGRGQVRTLPLLEFAVYLSFFPQLVAGPIVRASEFAPQLAARPDPRHVPSAEAFRLIFGGLFKKVVISTYLAQAIVDRVFLLPGDHSGAEILMAAYGYAIQIYADFSGYTDIAIGVALLLGFRFPQNFDSPYRALSIQDFWRRWHMTLSRWLRDYLYIPLGGNRVSRLLTYRNLMLTMLLGGLWHGAAWTFVIWGAIHGGMLAAERWIGEWRRAHDVGPILPEGLSAVIRWFVTFNVVCLAWIFFRAETFDGAMTMLGRLGDWSGGAPLVTPLLLLVVFGAILFQFVPQILIVGFDELLARRGWLVQGGLLAVGLVLIDVLGPAGVAPFIYFQF